MKTSRFRKPRTLLYNLGPLLRKTRRDPQQHSCAPSGFGPCHSSLHHLFGMAGLWHQSGSSSTAAVCFLQAMVPVLWGGLCGSVTCVCVCTWHTTCLAGWSLNIGWFRDCLESCAVFPSLALSEWVVVSPIEESDLNCDAICETTLKSIGWRFMQP